MPEPVRVTCPGCHTALRVPAELAGRAVKCKKCGAAVPPRPASAPGPVLAKPVAAKPAPPPPPAPPVRAIPVAGPARAPADPDDTFAVDLPPPAVPPRYARRPPARVSPVVWVAAGMLLAGGVVAAGVLALPHLTGGKTAELVPPVVPPPVPPGLHPPEAAAPAAVLPRRMLVLHVTKYLYCNALAAGRRGPGGDAVGEAARRLAADWRVPADKETGQLYVVSDTAGKDARPMLKPVIEAAVRRFCETSRPQDRVVIVFGGHAVEKDGKGYLVPADGDLADPASLVPVAEVWAALAGCPARQKVAVFDVCRGNEDGDRYRPGGEPMSDALAKALHSPPAGVQVVTSCSPGQQALEYRRPPADAPDVAGSLFLSALRHAADRGGVKPAHPPGPDDPLPVGPWVEAAAARMTEVAGLTGKPAPTPKVSGTEPPTLAGSPDESPARRFDLPAPPPGLPVREVEKVTRLIDLPPLLQDRAAPDEPLAAAVPFPQDVMRDHLPDGVSAAEVAKDPGRYKVRKAAADALAAIRKQWDDLAGKPGPKAKGKRPPVRPAGLLTRFPGQTTDALKKEILARQEAPAVAIAVLEEQVKTLEGLAGELDGEPAKYWRATFRYALAQCKARVAFLHEYNLALGNIRTDTLPDRDPTRHAGLQLVSVDKMKSKKDVREVADAAKELFGKVAADHPGTPWAVQAKRDRAVALGLEWRPYSAGGKDD